jgi:hypothetical protein
VQPLPTEGTISALNIPHSSIVFDLHQVTEIRAELLRENGMATERVKHADIVSFTCLKAFAFDQRFERKDAHDLIYCIEHAPDGLGAVVAAFGHALAGTHSAVIREGLDVLRCCRRPKTEPGCGCVSGSKTASSLSTSSCPAWASKSSTARRARCATRCG